MLGRICHDLVAVLKRVVSGFTKVHDVPAGAVLLQQIRAGVEPEVRSSVDG